MGKMGVNYPKTTLSTKKKIQWITGIVVAIVSIFWLLFFVTPDIKKNQKELVKEKTETVSLPF